MPRLAVFQLTRWGRSPCSKEFLKTCDTGYDSWPRIRAFRWWPYSRWRWVLAANTAIFTLIDVVLLRTLPVTNPQELVSLNLVEQDDRRFPRWADGDSRTAFPYTGYTRMRERNQV